MFPDIIPSKVIESMFYEIEVDDVLTEQDLQSLITRMYDHPERDFYYFQEKNGRSNELLDKARSQHEVLMDDVEFFYYRHPSTSGYTRIEIRDGRYQWDWQRQVVQKGPMFMRIRLLLSERKTRALEIQQKIEAERESDSNPLELKPNFMGLGIDIFKAGRWIKKLLKGK